MSEQAESDPAIWRPLVVRGVPLHFVLPVGIAAFGVALLVASGWPAIVGGWVLTVAFPLAIGAFVSDARALAVPAVLWAAWMIVVATTADGSGIAQTPLVLAAALGALGAAGVWLGQRAVQPAVDAPRARTARSQQEHGGGIAELELLESPSLDPSAEVDEALAELLAVGIDPDDGEGASREPAGTGDLALASNPQSRLEHDPFVLAADPEDAQADEQRGHVIEFAALREEDLAAADEDSSPDSVQRQQG